MKAIGPLISILSVKKDLRPIGRVECFSKDESDTAIEEIKKFSLCYGTVNRSGGIRSNVVKTHIYFVKNENSRGKIDSLINLCQRENRNHEMFIDANRKIGQMYNYPECCINWFLDFLTDWFDKSMKDKTSFAEPSNDLMLLDILSNSKGNSFNKAVNCCQNDSPIIHLPHSFKCRKSIKIGKDNLNILKEYDEGIFLKYEEYLKSAFRVYKNKIVKVEDNCRTKKGNIIFFK